MFGYWWVANGNVHTIASSPGWKPMYTLQLLGQAQVSPTLARCMQSTLLQNNGSFLHHGQINKSAGWQKSRSMSGDINHEKSVSLMATTRMESTHGPTSSMAPVMGATAWHWTVRPSAFISDFCEGDHVYHMLTTTIRSPGLWAATELRAKQQRLVFSSTLKH